MKTYPGHVHPASGKVGLPAHTEDGPGVRSLLNRHSEHPGPMRACRLAATLLTVQSWALAVILTFSIK